MPKEFCAKIGDSRWTMETRSEVAGYMRIVRPLNQQAAASRRASDPPPGKFGPVLTLQRLAGNHAVTSLLAHRSGSTSRQQPLQRKFGFEMEVPLLLTEQDDEGDPVDPKYRTGVKLGSAGESEVHVDHMAKPTTTSQLNSIQPVDPIKGKKFFESFPEGASIVEIVTDAWDESTLSETEVEDKMQVAVDLVDDLFTDTSQGTVRTPSWLGDPYLLGGDRPKVGAGAARANLQATYGVKTSQIPEMFRRQALLKPDDVASQVLTRAEAVAKGALARLNHNRIWLEFRAEDTGNQEELVIKPLLGFLSLAANYLVAAVTPGLKEKSALGKNQVGQMFYKSDLGHLINEMTAMRTEEEYTDNYDLSKFLGSGGSLNHHLAHHLCAEAGVTYGDPMPFLDGSKTYGDWLDSIFNGGKDFVFEALKNPYSDELGPNKLGPAGAQKVGPVMENRRLDLLFGTKSAQWYPTTKWPQLAKDLYALLREVNEIA